MDAMVEGTVTICNEVGIHARPASKFIAFVNKFKDSDIILYNGDRKGNAKSMLNVLTLELHKGVEMKVQVSGGDEAGVLKDVIAFVEGLGEE